jgi:hypothetical protein
MAKRSNDTWQEGFAAIATREVIGERKLKRVVQNSTKRVISLQSIFKAKFEGL